MVFVMMQGSRQSGCILSQVTSQSSSMVYRVESWAGMLLPFEIFWVLSMHIHTINLYVACRSTIATIIKTEVDKPVESLLAANNLLV